MSIINGRSCGNCAFSLPAQDGKGHLDFNRRFCRKLPPVPVLLPAPPPANFQVQSLWPTMSASDMCFSHEFAQATAAEQLLPGERNKPIEEKPS